ncbi:hypothetical protein [Candidatus Symbiopectobacterium sp. NZEC135]|uniref:hypothetical protein n=1 Tax=Candidatus Symbiopectobacterium sp. NZEC135 TaxID=2820471 RepID=UPI002227F0E2|nr:hypothetical protein [Candidatus Symbiopectobacterium sp. NZEC135]MCW2478392.1 hypothetical protein [Candidatus Symbiopectobacterium sp. NZEC135]
MTIGTSLNTSPGFGRYIQADVYHRMNRELPKTETVTDNMVGCANEGVSLAVKNFIKAPDKVGCVYGLIHTQSQAALPEDLRNANTTVECREIFKSILGMLATKADNFTSAESGSYKKLCDRFVSEVKKEPEEFNANISLQKNIKNTTKDDKQFWIEAAPLLETYSKDIVEDLIAHMLNQSINAWCEYHNVTDREWACSNIEQIFDTNIRMCFNVLDDEIRGVTKESKSAVQDKAPIHGAFIRFGYMKMFDAIASIPLSLRRQTPAGMAKPAISEKAVETSGSAGNVNGDHSPKASSSPGNITVYGSTATATSYGGNTPTTPPDPWSSMTEKLLASDKINTDQRFLLLKDLIATMGEQRDIPSSFFNRYPLLSRLNGISTQDLPAYSTLSNGNRTRLAAAPSPETNNVESTAPAVERVQTPRVQIKRPLFTTGSIGSDISTMSPPQSPLGDNFKIGTLSSTKNINPLASQGTFHTVGADLSSVIVDKGPAANDAEEAGRSEGASFAGNSSSGINKEDLALLKRWLGEDVQEDENERENINKLVLREEGLYTQTIEHFLERAFLAEAGTEERSDKQQTYINESFRKMQLHEDFFLLSRNAQALVDKYSEKRNFRVLTTTPGVRRSLSSQVSRG